MPFDPSNTVVALCAAGMAIEGEPDEAKKLFEQAWEKRSDDFDAAIAAHYLARHQSSASDKLRWDALAVEHAERVPDDGAKEMFPSLYLNLANSLIAAGRMADARSAAHTASEHIDSLPADGYREFLRMGIDRIQSKLDAMDPAQ
ncbi:MAG: rRNA adenine methyltransferase [Gemmatimonadaceae bacterium]